MARRRVMRAAPPPKRWPFRIPKVGEVVTVYWLDASYDRRGDDDTLARQATTGTVVEVFADRVALACDVCIDYAEPREWARRSQYNLPFVNIRRVHRWGRLIDRAPWTPKP